MFCDLLNWKRLLLTGEINFIYCITEASFRKRCTCNWTSNNIYFLSMPDNKKFAIFRKHSFCWVCFLLCSFPPKQTHPKFWNLDLWRFWDLSINITPLLNYSYKLLLANFDGLLMLIQKWITAFLLRITILFSQFQIGANPMSEYSLDWFYV